MGTCILVETLHPRHPYLAHSPTMRVPMTVSTTDYAYVALWAALLAVRRHNRSSRRKIRHLVCPGLGTGCGQLDPSEAARQMGLAWIHFQSPPSQIDWPFAAFRQQQIRRGGDLGRTSPP
ncbi:MAG: hypothetical protein U0165_19900 [Polyangiaceae bacterium]